MSLSEMYMLREKNKILNAEIDRLTEEFENVELENV
jgi:hypothetical protein